MAIYHCLHLVGIRLPPRRHLLGAAFLGDWGEEGRGGGRVLSKGSTRVIIGIFLRDQ